MTSAQLVERALRRITPAPPLESMAAMRTTLGVLVNDALRYLPTKVKERLGEADAEIYRKNYAVTLTSGQGDLSTHTNLATEAMIPSEIVKVTHPSAVSGVNAAGKLYKVGSESSLNLHRSTEFAYYAVEDNTLYTMKDNVRTTLTGTATVRAAYPPLITTVKASHEPILVDCLIELAQGVKSA